MFLQKKYAHLHDDVLLVLLKESDEKAFRQIYDRYWQKLLTLAIYKTGSKEKGQEIVQDLFVSLWEKRKVQQIEKLEHYLFRAIKFKIINQVKQLIKEKLHTSISDVEIEVHYDDLLTVSDLENSINLTFEHLPEKTALLFKQSRFEGKTNTELAEIHGLSIKAVEYHITKALKIFKENLKEYLPVFIFLQNIIN